MFSIIIAIIGTGTTGVKRKKRPAKIFSAGRVGKELLVGDFDDELAGESISRFESVDADFHLSLVELPADFGMRQAGNLRRQRQQAQELGHLLLLAVDPLISGTHGIPFLKIVAPADERLPGTDRQDVLGRANRFSLPAALRLLKPRADGLAVKIA